MSRRRVRGTVASSTAPVCAPVHSLSLSADDVAAAANSYRNAKPFPHATLRSFLTDEFAVKLSAELRSLDYYAKRSDLFSLSQSHELARCNKRYIAQLRSALYNTDMRTTHYAHHRRRYYRCDRNGRSQCKRVRPR